MLEKFLGIYWDSYAWYAASFLTAVSAVFNVALLSMSRNREHDEARKKYLWYVVAIAVWSSNVFIFSITQNWGVSYVACQLLHLGAIAIPVLLLDFVQTFYGYKSRWDRFERIAGYVIAALFTVILISRPTWMISGLVPKRGYSFFLNPGPLYLLWMGVFFYFVLSAHIKVLLAYFSMKGEEKRQAAYFVVPSLLAYTGCLGYFLPVYDLFVFPYPIGCFGSMTLPFIFGYMIVRYKLMGVDVFIKKTIVFAGLFGFIYGITATFSYLGQQFFVKQIGWSIWTAMIPSIVAIVTVIRPLENWLVNATDRYLFQKKYDYLELMKLFTGEVLTIFDFGQVTKNTVDALNNIIKLESCAVVLKPENGTSYKIVSSIGLNDPSIEFELNSPLVARMRSAQTVVQRQDSELNRTSDLMAIKQCLVSLDSEICVPIIFRKELVGFLSLGAKKSGDSYNRGDIDVLLSLARTEAIAISNARLFTQLAETQAEAAQNEKMATIGTLAAGINHEICNPLGIVRGQCEMFLLNYRDGIYNQLPDKEVLEQAVTIFGKIIKETDRATGITKRLSTFAKPNKHFQVSEVDVAREVDEVLAILGHELRLENVDIDIRLPKDFPKIMADRKELQEVLFNIIRNAAQAIKGSGRIIVGGQRNGTRAMITITDNGHGIPADKMEKIFHPFFTTKDPGKGTGLGLFIVKQIVERNEGVISVTSEVGKGTEFTLSFRLAKTESEAHANENALHA